MAGTEKDNISTNIKNTTYFFKTMIQNNFTQVFNGFYTVMY